MARSSVTATTTEVLLNTLSNKQPITLSLADSNQRLKAGIKARAALAAVSHPAAILSREAGDLAIRRPVQARERPPGVGDVPAASVSSVVADGDGAAAEVAKERTHGISTKPVRRPPGSNGRTGLT